MNDILNNIEAIRKEKRIKQEVIAEGLGIKQSTYSCFITRSKDITYKRLLQISNILGMEVIDIITWPEHYVPESMANHSKILDEKDLTIIHLNKYIEELERQLRKS